MKQVMKMDKAAVALDEMKAPQIPKTAPNLQSEYLRLLRYLV